MGPNEQQALTGRILDLTRAEAAYRDLHTAATDLDRHLETNIWGPESDNVETLTAAIGWMRERTADMWANNQPVHWGLYDGTRAAAIARAEAAAAAAESAAAAARRIADALTAAAPVDTTERMSALIDAAAAGLEDGQYPPDINDVWARLGPTDIIEPTAANELRRKFDTNIDYGTGNALAEYVNAWRGAYLAGEAGPIIWDAATFDYVIATARSWAELVDVWERLTPAAHEGHLTAAEAIRVRDTIAARVRSSGRDATVPPPLAAHLADYDTNTIALSARIRHAEQWQTLENVWAALKSSRDIQHLGIVRALLRRARQMQAQTPASPDPWGHTTGQGLLSELNEWHLNLYQTAADIAEGNGSHYDTEESYEIIYNAVAAAEDIGNTARLPHLIGYIDAAHTRGAITDEHRAHLGRIIAAAEPATV